MEPILGIDLGTTNSEVALIEDGKPLVLEEDGDPILPSVVGLGPDGRLLVGKPARNQWALAPERTIRSIKRLMGIADRVKLGDREYTPQEISALILRKLQERAARHLGRPVTKAVITVPAYFNDTQRQATREAGELAGLEVVRILNEPTAASLAYDPSQQERRHILVYDLGGGTFDVSVVQAQDGVVEVLASHGDTQLGGDDFDQLLLDFVCAEFQARHNLDLRDNLTARARVLAAVEEGKRQLSFHAFARIQEEFIVEHEGQPLHVDIEISRDDYEEMIRPLLGRTIDRVHRALEDAQLTPGQIDKVVLVGGSTRTPLVSQLLAELLGQQPHQEVNPDLCVALGAGIQSGIIAGLDVGAVLVDITPHSLGIECLDETSGLMGSLKFAPIVQRNTTLPASRSDVFYTCYDNQEAVEINIYQGEHRDVRHNHHLGQFRIEGLSPVPQGNELVVQLDLNLDGVLKVSAREKSTGLQKHIVVNNALTRQASKKAPLREVEHSEFWDEPADAAQGETAPVLVSAPADQRRDSVQVRALLEKATRLLDKTSAEDRQELQALIERVQSQLDQQQFEEAHASSGELADMVFYLEDA